ncbi:MAG TPA: hypothetical protein VGE85_06965 [Terracidiphilus sp.]|jgi:hypothetical protein
MMKLITSICLLVFVAGSSSDRFRKYHTAEAYEIRPGIIISPVYSVSHDLCEISIEKRHYYNNAVDMDAVMSKEEILSIFDELVSQVERGGPGLNLPPGTELSDSDFGMLETSISYKNVSLEMFGMVKKDRRDTQKYVAAIISWKKPECDAK